MKIAILTAGGDAPGMNACLYQLVKEAKKNKIETYGVTDGFIGLVNNNFIKLNVSSLKEVMFKGGTMLGSVRYTEFNRVENQDKAIENLKKIGIECLVCIGGDGTYQGSKALSKRGFNTIWIPSTIDNDVKYSEVSIGFNTACFNASEAILKIMDTMESHHRICVYEVMGRYCGDIARTVAENVNADLVIPYEGFRNIDYYLDLINDIYQKKTNKTMSIIISEHLVDINEFIKKIEDKTKASSRGVILGYIQRGGSPTLYDVELSKILANEAIKMILNNSTGLVYISSGVVNNSSYK